MALSNNQVSRLCLSFHTERLHDDQLWKKIKDIAAFLEKHKIRAVWFSINPAFVAYQLLGFNEKKWIDRLHYLSEHGQIIEQHTHFYKSHKGDCDLSINHIRKRLLEDREWLENQGYKIHGFVGGTWIINNDVLKALTELNYQYDCSSRTFALPYLKDRSNQRIISSPEKFDSLWQIPTTTPIKKVFLNRDKRQLIYLHDYDLKNFLIRHFLKIFIRFSHHNQFVTPLDLT